MEEENAKGVKPADLLSLDMVDRASKKSRANAKRQLTNAIRKVSDALTVGEDVGGKGKAAVCMENVFNDISQTCSNYRQLLEDEDYIEECMIYFHEAETWFLSMKDRVAFWKESAGREVDIKLDDRKKHAPSWSSQQRNTLKKRKMKWC